MKNTFISLLVLLTPLLMGHENVNEILNEINIFLEKEQYDQALDKLEKLEKENSDNVKILYLKAQILISLDRYHKADICLKKTEKKAYSQNINLTAYFFYTRGMVLHKIEEYQKSLEYLNKAQDKKPDLLDVYLEKAMVYNALGNKTETQISLHQYISREPDPEIRQFATDMLEQIKKEQKKEVYLKLNTGVEHFQKKNYEKALKQFLKVEKEYPENGYVHYYLGKTYRVVENYSRALLHFKKAKKLGVIEDIDFEMGIIALHNRKKEEAQKYLGQYVEQGKNKELVDFSQQSLRELEKVKPWFISLTTGGQYDTNVFSFGNDFVDIFVEDNDESAWAAFLELYIGYRLLETEKNYVDLGFRYFSRYYDDFSELNVHSMEFILGIGYKFGKKLSVDIEASYQYIYLGGESYQSRGNMFLRLAYEFTSWNKLEWFYNHTYSNDFTNNFFAELNRSGPRNLLGINKSFTFSIVTFGFGYSYRENSPEGEDLEYRSHILQASLSFELPYDILLLGSFNYAFTKYENGNLLLEGGRDDKTGTVAISVNKKMTDHFEVFSDLSYSHNSSEKEFGFEIFDYDRTFIRFGMTVTY
ncbi:tetratricopeptide repeat protein [Candidatus Uabimicrobium sp. HlEnr_7]|uniref:tetratricopeptide repeat protein n=1 Tax=Candidatus Uabimicrobium helgolandensis TaxID=3095367 RepID=UPI0035591157